MKIEIWSDYVCPFCYIGKRKLEEALANFPQKDQVDIEFKSYQLDPDAQPYTGQDFYESMAKKFGSIEQSKQMTVSITEQAKLVGLDFRFDTMKPTNTFDAHRLTKYAKVRGKNEAISEKLLYANFTESEDIGDVETLAKIAEEVGLDKEETLAMLHNKQAYADEVKIDLDEAKQFGITGVPYFIFNRKYVLSGAQQSDVFTQALNKVWEEEQSTTTFESLATTNNSEIACGEDGCDIPDPKNN